MTISDDMHAKLAGVTEQLGRERGKYDKMKLNHELLSEDYVTLRQKYYDLKREFEQYKELVNARN